MKRSSLIGEDRDFNVWKGNVWLSRRGCPIFPLQMKNRRQKMSFCFSLFSTYCDRFVSQTREIANRYNHPIMFRKRSIPLHRFVNHWMIDPFTDLPAVCHWPKVLPFRSTEKINTSLITEYRSVRGSMFISSQEKIFHSIPLAFEKMEFSPISLAHRECLIANESQILWSDLFFSMFQCIMFVSALKKHIATTWSSSNQCISALIGVHPFLSSFIGIESKSTWIGQIEWKMKDLAGHGQSSTDSSINRLDPNRQGTEEKKGKNERIFPRRWRWR